MRTKYIIAVAAFLSTGCRPALEETYADAGGFNFPGDAWDPAAAAVTDGRIYIADTSLNSAVQVFDGAGIYLGGFGGYGRGLGDVAVPTDVTVGLDGLVYVSEFGNRRISVFTPDGGFVKSVGEGILVSPLGVAAGRDGRVWVADPDAGGIVVFNADGARIASRLPETPTRATLDVALTPRGEVAVAAVGDEAARIYDAEGRQVRCCAPPGANFEPTEVAFAADGRCFVLGRRATGEGAFVHAVAIFGAGGRFEREVPVDLTDPTGVAALGADGFLVADPGRHAVRRYRRTIKPRQ